MLVKINSGRQWSGGRHREVFIILRDGWMLGGYVDFFICQMGGGRRWLCKDRSCFHLGSTSTQLMVVSYIKIATCARREVSPFLRVGHYSPGGGAKTVTFFHCRFRRTPSDKESNTLSVGLSEDISMRKLLPLWQCCYPIDKTPIGGQGASYMYIY